MAESRCVKCSEPLNGDEIAIYKRLVSRFAEEYLCVPCLAEYYRCSTAVIQDRIAYYKRMGCTLFVNDDSDEAASDNIRSRWK
ncbi:MAG: hypothetical protein WAQ49_04560 [Limnochordia bacterium]|jgi:hypothetical protein|nr:hypothetical protein [Bacillota bacterium]NLH30299.1 hypothetical protein [Bacillota bacterium]